MFENKLTKARLEKAKKIEESGKNPFSSVKEETGTLLTEAISIRDFKEIAENKDLFDDEKEFLFLGRVMLLRKMGKSGFFHFIDESGEKQQAFASLENLGENYPVFKNMMDIGDIVKISGTPFYTKTGELTIKVKQLEIMTKALSPLPEKFHGLEDKELRYRKRYLDLIMNKDVRDTFSTRSKIISEIRRVMDANGFMEVETPMLNPIPGGANARPFVTHHNAMGVDRFLRIAPELYLKRLIVGGYNLVYEIGKNFRNEGVDSTHNPEFTSMEMYSAYTSYMHLAEFIKNMINDLVDEIGKNTEMTIDFKDKKIDFKKWKVLSFRKALVEIGGVPEEILDNPEEIKNFLKKKNITKDLPDTKGKLWEVLFDEFVEEQLINPTFITEYPVEISPLARRSEKNPEIAERFELFIGGMEIANGFNELNDPMDQYERFKQQVEQKGSDDESMHMDKDFVEALMYGMPPTAGAGIGIDRLVMLLTNSSSIRDVIFFPAMK